MYFKIILLLILALVIENQSEGKFNFKNNKAQNDTNKNQLNGDYVELIKSEIRKFLPECANGGGGGGGGDGSGEDNSDSERYPKRGPKNNQDDGYGNDGYDRNQNARNFGQNPNKRQSFGGQGGPSGSHRGGGGSERERGGSGSERDRGGSDRYGGGSDGGSDRYGGGSDRYGGGSDRYGGGSDRYGGGSDRYGGGSDRYGGGSERDRGYGRGSGHGEGSDREHRGRGRGGYDEESGDSRGGYGGHGRNSGHGYDSYGGRNGGDRDGMGGGRQGQSEYGSRSYGGGGYIRSKRAEGNMQCTSQCIFGYLEVLDENRSPSESAMMKWIHDNMQNDAKRIKAIREIRRCFGRLAAADKNDGCAFSKSLSNCMNLEIET